MARSRRLRFEILRRDGHRCRYCGATAADEQIVVDHVIPVALGGTDEPSNLVAACRSCNAGKSSTKPDDDLVEDVDAHAQLMADALRIVAMERRAKQDELAVALTHFREHLWGNWQYDDGSTVPLPQGWQTSIERFLELGLDVVDLQRFVRVAMTSKARGDGVFAYLCGCAWNEIRARQDAAREIVLDQITQPAGDPDEAR